MYFMTTRLLLMMFCAGVFSVFAQVLLLRESLVAFFGSELSIGIVLSTWFTGIVIGAVIARFMVDKFRESSRLCTFIAVLLFGAGVFLPFELYFIRIIRTILNVPLGEIPPFGSIFLSSFLILFPISFCIGMIFPFVCKVLSLVLNSSDGSGTDKPVRLIYSIEALGSMIGGTVLTFVLLPHLIPSAITGLGISMALTGACLAVPSKILRRSGLFFSLIFFLAIVCFPSWMYRIEKWAVIAQWRAFKVLEAVSFKQVPIEKPPVRLVTFTNSLYQNLAITESDEQFVMYGNGQVMFIFPDPIGYEHSVHFIMAQKPKAKSVLLIGGNPVGDIPEILKYPIDKLVYVEMDSAIVRLIRETPIRQQVDKVLSDPRIKYIPEDARHYVRSCQHKFDVIIVNSGEQTTAGSNRCYTLEFFQQLKRIMKPDGILYAAVTSSERLMSEAADVGASVYKTLRAVFPVVMFTAEDRTRYFAGYASSGLTFDREILYTNSASAGITYQYFKPEYFLRADELSPEKIEYRKHIFENTDVPLNTDLRPITYFYNLILLGKYSGSVIESLLRHARRLKISMFLIVLLGTGMLSIVIGYVIKQRQKCTVQLARNSLRWAKIAIIMVIFSTGFSAIALETVLLFIFQSVYGYIYTHIGLIVSTFMMGLVGGSITVNFFQQKFRFTSWYTIITLELMLLIIAVLLPYLVSSAYTIGKFIFYLAVAIVGWLVGAEFPLGNKLFYEAGGTIGIAAALLDASDHLGAAIGAIIVGVLLLPLLGISGTCIVIGILKCCSLMFIYSAKLVCPAKELKR